MIFNFPETIFVEKNTTTEQLEHVISEAYEVRKELADHDQPETQLLDLEMMDLMHSCETYFRKRTSDRGKVYVDMLIDQTVEKNARRGYYVQDVAAC